MSPAESTFGPSDEPTRPSDGPGGHGPVRRTIRAVSATLAALAAIGILAIMVATVADVTRRAATDQAVAGVVEFAPLVLVVAVVLGFSQAEATGTHVRTSLVTSRLPARASSGVRVIAFALVLALLAWMVWLTTGRAISSVEAEEMTSGFIGLPVWPARLAIPIGLAAFALEIALELADDLRVVAGRAAATPGHSSLSDLPKGST